MGDRFKTQDAAAVDAWRGHDILSVATGKREKMNGVRGEIIGWKK